MELAKGKEKDFIEFIDNIGGNDKVALLTHTDLDGVASGKVVEQCVKIDFLKFVDYGDVGERLVEKLEENKITKLIITDIAIENFDFIEAVERFAQVLIIDHHKIEKDFNSEKIVFINAQGYCAAFICYVLFSKIKDISQIDWLVACACVSDFLYFKNQEWMKKTYEKYGKEFNSDEEGIKKGKFWRVTGNITFALIYFEGEEKKVFNEIGKKVFDVENLEKYANKVRKSLKEYKKSFWEEKKVFGDIYFWKFEPRYGVKSIIINIVSKKEKDKTFIFISPHDGKYTISARRQDGKVDLPKFLKKLLEGFENSNAGGHIPAAGGYFPKKYLGEFEKRLEELH